MKWKWLCVNWIIFNVLIVFWNLQPYRRSKPIDGVIKCFPLLKNSVFQFPGVLKLSCLKLSFKWKYPDCGLTENYGSYSCAGQYHSHFPTRSVAHLSLIMHARRQNSVTGGGEAEINFGGHQKFFYVNLRGAREIYPSLDQMNKVKTKTSEGFFGRNQKFKQFLRPKTGDFKKKKEKKRSSSQKCHEIRCQSSKITKIICKFGPRLQTPIWQTPIWASIALQ